VVFDAGRSTTATNAKRIAGALIDYTGVAANTVVFSANTLRAAIAGNPLLDRMDDPSRMLVGFITDNADRAPLHALVDAAAADGNAALGPNAFYLWCPDGILESKSAQTLIGPSLREIVTSRNWSTVLKLHALTEGNR
jgi:uncharacterized protein (DUF1697 family)